MYAYKVQHYLYKKYDIDHKNNLSDVCYNHCCGLVMCRFRKNITIAHKNVVQHLVQCRLSD